MYALIRIASAPCRRKLAKSPAKFEGFWVFCCGCGGQDCLPVSAKLTHGGFNSQVQLSQILFCYPVNFSPSQTLHNPTHFSPIRNPPNSNLPIEYSGAPGIKSCAENKLNEVFGLPDFGFCCRTL